LIHPSLFVKEASVSILFRRQWRSGSALRGFALVMLGLFCAHHSVMAQSGKLLSENTKKGYSKSNQSKVFFHDGKWWAMAYDTDQDQWYIWQYVDTTWAAKSPAGNISSSARPDVVLEAAANKLYILFAGSKASDFYRMTYSSGAWSIDAGFPKALSALGTGDSKNPASLGRAMNGELWIFRIKDKILSALRSTDNGSNWSGLITVKSGLNYKKGTVDARAFSFGGKNYLGVAYGEVEKIGVKTRFGFLYHLDGDLATSWPDESPALTMMGKENSTSNICLNVDAANNLYLFTQNDSAAGADPRNTLYKRNATTGLWQAFKVNISDIWTSPAIAVQGSSKLFLMGINKMTNRAEYKIVSIAKENLAASASPNALFENGADIFLDVSAPFNAVDATTQLMVCAENNTTEAIWYNRVEIAGSGGIGCNPPAAAGPAAIAGTKGGGSEFYKPNQSKVFYHDGAWWIAAQEALVSEWFLWKKQGTAWIKMISLGTPSAPRPDCYIDSPNNKLYVIMAQNSARFLRFTYNPEDGTWALDPGFPVTLTGFSYQSENPSVVTRAKNGDLWVFGSRAGILFARRSTNGGQTWSPDIKVKTLNVSLAICDAVAFTSNGQNYVGVGYAEDTDPKGRFGFLMHKDGDLDNMWPDESAQIGLPLSTQADDHINLAVSANQEIYMVVKTKPGGANAAGVNLYKRAANGGWSSFLVFKGSQETRPALAIDETNSELYIFTTLLNTPRYGRYKKCAIGNEASLATAEVKNFFQNGQDDFYNVSPPPHRVNHCTGLMIAAENKNSAKIWYQMFPINGGDVPPATPVVVGNVTVTPTTASQTAAYSIPLTLGATGALTAGSSTITVVWPNGTTVPAAIANTAVTVNGVNAISVTTAPAARQAIVQAPANLAGGTTVTLAFAAAAGIVNPATIANYTLTVQTSSQPIDAISPAYAITSGIVTPVTVGAVAVSPDTVNLNASYAIPLTLGATGALTAGLSTITITWPHDTMIPAAMANAAVTVNGVNASAVTTNAATRQAIVTVPSNIAGGANVNLIFLKTAGIKTPTTAGDYTLQAQTSAQPVNVSSPAHNIKAVAPPPPQPSANTGQILASRTKSPFDKSSQSKVFYLGGKWWTVSQDSVDVKWYLFFENGNTWTRSNFRVDSRAGSRADMIVDAASNRLYLLSSQGTSTYFNRVSYSNGNWILEALVPLAGFDHGDGSNVVTMARAKNGNLWVFRINNGILEAQVSTDNGNFWSATMPLKTGLTGKVGQTDAVAFGSAVGVFYAMAAAAGGTQIGFMKNPDGNPNTTWTEDINQINFFGSEGVDNWVSANALSDGTVYAITRNKKGGASDPNNTLYKRSPSGAWSKFKINTGANVWTSPALAIDASNNRLFVMGIRTTAPMIGEFKWCALGNESALESAAAIALFQNSADNFGHLSTPLAHGANSTGLLVVAGNTTKDDLWFNKFNLGTSKRAEEVEAELAQKRETEINNFSDVQLFPNPFNPATTIRFAVQEPARVKLQIFNLRGELVRTLADGELSRGLHEKRWNGRDNAGRQAASGLYFYRLQIGNRIFNGRMQMLK
jgi:hypothetical protein